jgi:hypothetical protein
MKLKLKLCKSKVVSEMRCIAGYYTRLRHIDFYRRLASAMTIPSGLALVLHYFIFLIL